MATAPKSPATEAAETLRAATGQIFGVIQLWGIMPVQPNDSEYKLTFIKADGDRLDLTLDGYDHTVLSVYQPEGLKLGKESLEIKSAARVTWTWGAWDLHVEGKTLHVKGGASQTPATRPNNPKDPAVLLKRA